MTTLTVAFCNFERAPKKNVARAFGLLHWKYSRTTETIGTTGTRQLAHQKCCAVRTFPNLFKFCVRSKKTAKSNTVCLECVPFICHTVKLRCICQKISNTVWSATAHCYLSLVYIKKLIFLHFSHLASPHLSSSVYADWRTWINVSLHAVSLLLPPSFLQCAQSTAALPVPNHALRLPLFLQSTLYQWQVTLYKTTSIHINSISHSCKLKNPVITIDNRITSFAHMLNVRFLLRHFCTHVVHMMKPKWHKVSQIQFMQFILLTNNVLLFF